MTVKVIDLKSGKEKTMPKRFADILLRMKRVSYPQKGTYQTKDMVASKPEQKTVEKNPDGLDDLDLEQLHELAEKTGVKVHHKAGPEKVREALRAAE